MSSNWISNINLASVNLSPTSSNVQLFIGPDQDNLYDLIRKAISAAQKSIWIEMYYSSSPDMPLLLDVQAKAGTGIDVQLLYEKQPLGNMAQSGLLPPGYTWAKASQALVSAGNPVKYTHAKLMLIDAGVPGHEQAYIMTTNFTEQATGTIYQGSYRPGMNREYIVLDTNSQDIALLSAIFHADAQGAPPPDLTGIPYLLVSSNPYQTGAASVHAILHKLIDSATSSICIQVEDIEDPFSQADSLFKQGLSIEKALVDASQHVPEVKVVLPTGADTSVDANGNSITQRLKSGNSKVQTRLGSKYTIHGKVIIVDQQRMAFVGSQDLSRGSLNFNREFGVLISDILSVKRLYNTFQQDWQTSQG